MDVVQNRGGNESGEQRRLRARERVLQEAVADLRAEVSDLQRQLAAVAEAHGPMQADGRSELPAAVGDAGPQPAPGGPVAILRRLGKTAIRGSLGVVRRLWAAADPAQRYVVAPRLAPVPAAALPSVTVLVDGAPAVDRTAVLRELARQTAAPVEVAFWDRSSASVELYVGGGSDPRSVAAASPQELLASVAGDYVLELAAAARDLPSTLLEVLQWAVASEQLGFIRAFARPVDGDAGSDDRVELLLQARELWRPGGVDLGALVERARTRPVVGKTVGLAGMLDAAVPRLVPLGPESRGTVCRTGRYDVWAGNRAGPVEHTVRPLPPASRSIETGRPVVLVLLATPLTGGAGEGLAAIIREIGGRFRFTVAALSADHQLGVSRALAMERLGATVYELGSSLHPGVWPSAVGWIVASHRPVSVLAVGHEPRLDGLMAELRGRGVRMVALGDSGSPVANGAEATLTAAGPSPSLWAGVGPPGGAEEVSAERRSRVRRELGIIPNRWLVVAVTDLVPAGRPEDVVVVADRLRDQPDMAFVIVGDGPLAGTVLDLAAFLDVRALSLRRPAHDLWELVAAADLVLDPSEEALLRPSVAAALAMGRPVVTAPGGGAEELVGEIGGGVVVPSCGDPEALAGAVREVRNSGLRPDPSRARELVARRVAAARRTAAGVLDADRYIPLEE